MTRPPLPDEAAIQRALQGLDDPAPQVRTLALATLARGGTVATTGLLQALPTAEGARRQAIVQALAETADPRSREALRDLLADPDPLVRGRAAEGLARLRDAHATDALLHTLNDLPDLLHWPFTAAVHGLVAMGPPVLPAVAPLLSSDDPVTRARAFEVVRQVLIAERGDAAWQALLGTLGTFDPATVAPERAAGWQGWLSTLPAQARPG